MEAVSKKRKRKTCTQCSEEFTARHLSRHSCNKNQETKKNEQQTSSSANTNRNDKDIHVPVDFLHYSDSDDLDSDVCFDAGFSDSSDNGEELLFVDRLLEDEYSSDDQMTDFPNDHDDQYLVYFFKMLLKWQALFYISDRALEYLILLFRSLLYIISLTSDFASELYKKFPSTLYQLNKFISFERDNFRKLVVCPKCYATYEFEECIEVVEGLQTSKQCRNVVFPNHSLAHFRRPCGELLLKLVNINGSKKLVARKTFCYKSLEESVKHLVNRKGFEDQCEAWRNRIVPEDIMIDIYDGDVWKDFNGRIYNFFTEEGNYGVMLNVDWFQPFKYTNYSVGAVYLTILNLPRQERFKKKNIILVGLIPDMKSEPPTNSFIEPLVEELRTAWNGFTFNSFKCPQNPATFKLALICVGCDIPASRKLCGFLGHSATKGCNKCTKSFLGGVGEKNYGGFDISSWELRNLESHKETVRRIVKCKTKTNREQLEKEYGVRYSVLLELEYFDPIRMTIIDPMHNLFLGTAKRMLILWKDHKILMPEHFNEIQNRMEAVQCPSDVGKLPQKFASSFGSFNADQYKNWTILFSIFALNGILPVDHLEYWRKFVIACKLLCTRYLSRNNVKVAHLLLISFCRKVEQAFGCQSVTPNMHMHAHLNKCLYDFGPVYSFWLFSFERENGVLGSIPTNKREIETQLMRKFLKYNHCEDLLCYELESTEENFGPDFQKLCNMYDDKNRGTLNEMNRGMNYDFVKMSSKDVHIDSMCWALESFDGIKISTLKNCSLSERDVEFLKNMYNTLYSSAEMRNMEVCKTCRSPKYVDIFGSVLGVKIGRSCRSSMIIAYWHKEDGQICSYNDMELTPRPGQIQKLIVHNVIIGNKSYVHLLARVQWFSKPDEQIFKQFGKPVEAWHSNVYDVEGPSTYIPVQRIKAKFVYAFEKIRGKQVIAVMPRERFLC